jgi:hypothetical protein
MPAWSNTDTNSSKPTWTKTGNRNQSNANTYGVSILEKQQTANSSSFARSAAHQGWVRIQPQYTDSSGNIRRKAETLVVQSTSISGNANVAISGTVNVSSLSANVVGVNTKFTTELKIGDVINVGGGNVGKVLSVTNATFMTANANGSANGTGLTLYVGDSAWFPLT